MTRLIDRVVAIDDMPEEQRKHLSGLHVIAGDNIARYFFESAGKDRTSWSLRDFPCCAPPLPEFWLDFRAPSQLLVNGKVEPWDDGVSWAPKQWGVYVSSHECDAKAFTDFYDPSVKLPPIFGVRWRLKLTIFVMEDKRHTPFTPAVFEYALGSQGEILEDPTISGKFCANQLFYPGWYPTDTAVEMLQGSIQDLVRPALLTISFMHCKNVTQEQVKPEDWILRNAQKRMRPPPVTYHVLNIEPMKTVLRTEGQSEKTGLKKALHICRGHFATYDEKPLFGKVRGTFWRPSHVRGSLSEGAVVKDYRVLEPKQQQNGGTK